MNVQALYRRVTRGLMLRRAYYLSKLKRTGIKRHLRKLSAADLNFTAYPSVAVLFETFNKSHVIGDILRPFLEAGFKNLILFADGCADRTGVTAARSLRAKNHFVINSNNLHEVYATALAVRLIGPDADYLLLCQDDDLYPEQFGWLDEALRVMKDDSTLAIMGFNGGYNFAAKIEDADQHYATAEFRYENGVGSLLPYYVLEKAEPGYVSVVNRAPMLVRLSFLNEVGGWPTKFAPSNYDDIYMCLTAWKRGYTVMLARDPGILRDVGIGGTRLLGALSNPSRRPEYLGGNWHHIYEDFGNFINGGALMESVKLAKVRNY